MREEALRIIEILKNSDNEYKHLKAIDQMIETFQIRWHQNSGIEFDDLIYQINLERTKFLTRLNSDDTV
jgi:hypothetical protein